MAVGIIGDNPGPLENAMVFALGLIGVVLLRRHWSSLRAWNARTEVWLLERPILTVGIYALVGTLFGWEIGRHLLVLMLLGGLVWGFMGWWHIRLGRNRRGSQPT
jgi:hypothetical protein